MDTQWSDKFAARVRGERSSAIKDILKLTQRPEIISFAGGLPAAELFPRERVIEATQRLLRSDSGFAALQYGIAEGYVPLREMIARQTALAGVPATVDNVLVTSGSQQSLDLLGKVFIDPGDRILVEEPTYLGMLQCWKMYGAAYDSVASDDCGLIPEALEQALKAGPAKLIYLAPTFQNPTGVTMTDERRVEVVRLARQYGVSIIEDDAYGALRYSGQPVASLMSLDLQAGGSGNGGGSLEGSNVISVGTFSKTMAPGFRVAWVIAPLPVIDLLSDAKEKGDIHTSTFAQAVLYETARDGFIEQHVEALKKPYQERRDLMLSLMEQNFPEGVTWTRPEGGLFVWVRLPEGYDSTELLKQAIEQGVAFVPGVPFYADGSGRNTFRMNFSNASLDGIREGMARLSGVLNAVGNPTAASHARA
jgi:2-aminoadipate transaminase